MEEDFSIRNEVDSIHPSSQEPPKPKDFFSQFFGDVTPSPQPPSPSTSTETWLQHLYLSSLNAQKQTQQILNYLLLKKAGDDSSFWKMLFLGTLLLVVIFWISRSKQKISRSKPAPKPLSSV